MWKKMKDVRRRKEKYIFLKEKYLDGIWTKENWGICNLWLSLLLCLYTEPHCDRKQSAAVVTHRCYMPTCLFLSLIQVLCLALYMCVCVCIHTRMSINLKRRQSFSPSYSSGLFFSSKFAAHLFSLIRWPFLVWRLLCATVVVLSFFMLCSKNYSAMSGFKFSFKRWNS